MYFQNLVEHLIWSFFRKNLMSESDVIFLSLHKKWSFPLRISSINVTSSAECCEFGYIYWINSVENLIDTTAFQTYMKARRKYRRSKRLHLTIFIVSLNLTVTLTMSVLAPQALVLVRVIVCAAKHNSQSSSI